MLLPACTNVPSSQQRFTVSKQLASSELWQDKLISTPHFDLFSYQPTQHVKESLLTVYIEGDGLAWLNKRTLSINPTPIKPVGLMLALKHPRGNAVYLARPCQYTGGTTARNCNKHYWSDSRFAEQVITSTNEALDILKTAFNAKQLQLVGYSGGGTIAALLTARRNDVVRLVTVAGNLDHSAWSTYHDISPLLNSLNPPDYNQILARVEQIHFVGENDKTIPPFLTQQFVAKFHSSKKQKVILIQKFDHHCCWGEQWDKLMPLISEQTK